MKVSDLQHHQLFTAQADESLDLTADRMNWHQVGALPVLEGQQLVGIITERDVTAAMAEGADPVITPVSDYMTPAPEVLRPWPSGSSACTAATPDHARRRSRNLERISDEGIRLREVRAAGDAADSGG